MRIARAATFLLLWCAAAAQAADWLEKVAPLMTPAEKRAYLALTAEAKVAFEENFWNEKAITAEEYYRRLEFVDSNYGSTRAGSGANTDQGRVYLSLGAPDKITRIPSSRIFTPLEIWYYNAVPGVIETELHLIFYQKNSLGLPKLYSPTQDTVRALLLPQSSTVHMFGPNDDLTESTIRQNLNIGPAEDEVIVAAVGVAAGVKHSGNDELLALVASPRERLRKAVRPEVESRFVFSRPPLEAIQSNSPFGGRQVDLSLTARVAREIDLQVTDGSVTVYQNQLHLKFTTQETIRYAFRLDLLPGVYMLIFSLDGKAYPYNVTIPREAAMSEIMRGTAGVADAARTAKPLLFGESSFEPAADGASFLVTLPNPGRVNWILRKGAAVVTKTFSDSSDSAVAVYDMPAHLEPGTYELEALSDAGSRSLTFSTASQQAAQKKLTLLSFNANLQPSLRWAQIGHQWLLKNNLAEARRCLEKSVGLGVTKTAVVELARTEALAGEWDKARNRIRHVLAGEPNDFDSLSVLAYIETQLQDYEVAAQLYRRALAIQDSPALRSALASLPQARVAN